MFKLSLILFTFSVASAEQVAHVDLTAPRKIPEPLQGEFHVRGGGVLGHGKRVPAPDTPPLSLHIRSVSSGKSRYYVVEVEVTNTGKDAVSVPIGTETVPLLDPSQQNRHFFWFTTVRKVGGHDIRIDTLQAASHGSDPTSSLLLQPGDSILVSLKAFSFDDAPNDEIAAMSVTL